MKKTIAIDMDGVIADVAAQFVEWYERDYHVRISIDAISGMTEEQAFPGDRAVRKFVTTPGFFRTLPVMPGAIQAVKTLMERFEVYIVSAAMEFPLSLSEKLEWLNEHFPFIQWRNIIFCGDKRIINTDYMIDDHIKNLDPFKGKTIMFHQFYNAAYTHHRRVNNWQEILEIMQEEA